MTSEELEMEVAATIASCRDRIQGIGRAQYDHGTHQRFETKSPAELLVDLIEEAEDLIVYGVMVRIRARQILDHYTEGS
jgi:Uri superfamily endonuclease